MNASDWSSRQGHRLVQLGVLVFLIALLVGLAVPKLAVPRLGLSAHLLGVMQGLFLMVTGLFWPRLRLSGAAARVTFWLLIYGSFAAWAANMLGAVWGAGNSILTMAAGAAHGSEFQETAIATLLRTAGLSLIIAIVLMLWGLRIAGTPDKQS